MEVHSQCRRYVLLLCVVLLAAGVFVRALENRLSLYRDDPSPAQYITKGARLAECRLVRLDIPAVVETSAITTPQWFEYHPAADFQIPAAKLDCAPAIPPVRGPPSASL